jgi:hypothetical protein
MHRNEPPSHNPTYSAMSIAVKERDGRTQAKIELHWAGWHLVGTGVAYRHPSDCLTDEVGRGLATARALSDLADRLLAVSAAAGIAGSRRLTVP